MQSEDEGSLLKSSNDASSTGFNGSRMYSVPLPKRRPGGEIYNICCALHDEYERLMKYKCRDKTEIRMTPVQHPFHSHSEQDKIDKEDTVEECLLPKEENMNKHKFPSNLWYY